MLVSRTDREPVVVEILLCHTVSVRVVMWCPTLCFSFSVPWTCKADVASPCDLHTVGIPKPQSLPNPASSASAHGSWCPQTSDDVPIQLTCDFFSLLSFNSYGSSLNRNRMRRVEIAKPLRPPNPSARSTRRTCPSASTRALGSKPWSTGRKS